MDMQELKACLPKGMSNSVTTEMLDTVNSVLNEPEFYKVYRDNILSYTSVMQDGKYKTSDYLNAVKYVSYKLMGHSNFLSYTKTFPDRYKKLLDSGVNTNTISSYVCVYNKNKLVNAIFAQTMIPSYVLNQDLYQQAINTQAELMLGANSEKVRSDAANSLLIHLKPPEASKIQLDVNIKKDDSIDQLANQVAEFVAMQKAKIINGECTAKGLAESRIIKSEEVED